MKVWNKGIAGLLTLSLIWLGFPGPRICSAGFLLAQADMAPITRHAPRIKATPEQEISIVKAEDKPEDRIPEAKIEEKMEDEGKKGVSKWIWVGLAVLVAGGLALALSGGGGGGDDSSNPSTEPGSVTVGW